MVRGIRRVSPRPLPARDRCYPLAAGAPAAPGFRAELEFFDITQPVPAGVNVVEAGWPQAPAGWRIVASSQAGNWVTWRKA